jgi:glycosyltransferase involved in cell wall biosynthesis
MKNSPPTVLDVRVVSGTGGGPDKTILNSPRFLKSAGYRICCAYLHSPGDPGFDHLKTRAQELDATLLPVPDRGPLDWKVIPSLLAICKQENVRIWHGHDYKSNLLGLLLKKLRPMRLVTTVHGWVQRTRRTPLYYAIDRLCLPHYDTVLCVSPDLREQCLACDVPSDVCMLLENAIDTVQFTREREVAAAKRDLGFDPHRWLIGAVGRLSAEKGFDVLLRAVTQLVHRGLDVGLMIVGDGPERTALTNLIATLGMTDRIQLLGYRSDARKFFEAMDVFALSSLREGLPNVLLEAMAMEVPVVATRIGGVPRLIENGENGLLVKSNEPAALANAIYLLLKDGDLRNRLARAARQTIEQRYSFAERIRKLANLYDALLAREDVRPASAGLALQTNHIRNFS